MAKRTGGFIGQDGINAPDQATGVSGSAGDGQVTVSWTAPSDVGGAAITGYNVQSADGSGSYESSYDLGNASYDNVSFDLSGQMASPEGIRFNSDGTKLFIANRTDATIYQYSLSEAFDISSCSYDNVSLDVTSQDSTPTGLNFNNDGTKMYVCGSATDRVLQYTLTAGFDLSTASYDNVSFSVGSQENNPRDVCFNNDGTKMYVLGSGSDAVFQYSLSTDFNIGTASYDNVSFSIDDNVPDGMTFNADGSKLFIVGATGDSVYQYSLSTEFDLSSMSYDNVSFSVSGQELTPRGIEFSNSGAKMYVCGAGSDSVFEYSTGLDTYPTASPVTVTGLTNGTSYTFNVWAINPFGWSTASDASGSVSPSAPIGLIFSTGVSRSATIDAVNISSTGNATDFGDLTIAFQGSAGFSSSTRGIIGGGSTSSETTSTARIEYVTIATTGSGAYFGDLTRERSAVCGASNSTRGLFFAGIDGPTRLNIIDYVTIDTLGNAVDFGDLSTTFNSAFSTAGSTRGLVAGGYDGGQRAQIEYVTIASTGSSTSFGNLTSARNSGTGCASDTRGIFAGGSSTNIIEYVTISSTGNATDFGDLTVARSDVAGFSSLVRGVFAAGSSQNVIDYITIASTGNATDFGDLTASANTGSACSNAHGGLS